MTHATQCAYIRMRNTAVVWREFQKDSYCQMILFFFYSRIFNTLYNYLQYRNRYPRVTRVVNKIYKLATPNFSKLNALSAFSERVIYYVILFDQNDTHLNTSQWALKLAVAGHQPTRVTQPNWNNNNNNWPKHRDDRPVSTLSHNTFYTTYKIIIYILFPHNESLEKNYIIKRHSRF